MNKSISAHDLRRLPLFAEASDEAVGELLSEAPSQMRRYERGELIALQGSSVRSLYILLEGAIRAQMTNSEGKRLTMDMIVAPDLLAAAFIYGSENKLPVTIEATEPSLVWRLDREYFLGFMSRHVPVMRAFLRLISDRSHFLSQKINALNLQSLRERLVAYLRTHGTVGKQEELALLLGVARPSLARLLSELVDEGVLCKDASGYCLASGR
ncbi:MAG: Crp/Fnr family transcriptional regulator [Porphyromonas sp.]|nr:Crp/Fnr family transcriptional regulator [Porphyromonas sp.]